MKKLIILILLILAPTIHYSQAKKLYRKALRTTNLKEKIELLNQVVAQEPKNFDALFYRGIVKNDLEDYYGAILDYSKILIYKPDADTYYNRGNSKFNLQDYLGAKYDYENALKLDSLFIDAQYNLACSKYYLEDYIGSITDLTKIIKITPTVAKFYVQRANALLELKKHKLALKDFSMGILINPNANNYYNRALTLLNINYYKQAKKDFDKSLHIDTNNPSAFFYRGASHLLLGKYKRAISDFKTTLKYNALDYEAILGLALTYFKMSDFPKAKSHLKKAQGIVKPNGTKNMGIDLFKDTFWYQNQFYFFKQNFEALNKL